MLKAAIIGAGSTYTPELIGGFIDRADSLRLDNITLMDISEESLNLVVATKNRGAVPFMDDDDVVEVKCRLGKDGVAPQPVSEYNSYIVGLMRVIKAYEKLTVRAALNGDRDLALEALMVHPLIGDSEKAIPLLDEMLEANREYLPRFFA